MDITPSSTRRITTRSQNRAASTKNRTTEEIGKSTMISENLSAKKKQQQDRSALIDITNDSPIVGVAMGNLETPSSAASKKRVVRFLCTPCSGEDLLRGQVKTLLQKVDETRPFFNIQGLVVASPINLLAPTPANTPQVLDFSDDCVAQDVVIPEIACDQKVNREPAESSESGITRSLLLDFSDSSDCSSALTYEGTTNSRQKQSSREKLHIDEEDSSVWSIEANASSTRHDDSEVVEEEEYYAYEDEEEDYYDYEDEDEGQLLDVLYKELSKVNVGGGW